MISVLISYNLPFFGTQPILFTRPKFKLFKLANIFPRAAKAYNFVAQCSAARVSHVDHSGLKTRLAHIYFH